jgi:hypothetical protein
MTLDLIFGNSHTVPYARGHRLATSRGQADSDLHRVVFEGECYQPWIQQTENGLTYHPAAAERLCAKISELQPSCLITAVHGADHWILGMGNEERAFDFCVPALPKHPVSPEAELIPYDLLVRRYRGDLGWQFGLVRAVQRFSTLPIFHLEAPPPVENVELMLKSLSGGFEKRMQDFGLPSVSFRYKIWWLWTHMTKLWCAELGLHFLEGPPSTRDANGFLRECYHSDGVHGNDDYGERMVQEVAKAKQRLGV